MACNSEKVEHHCPSAALHSQVRAHFHVYTVTLSKFHLQWPLGTSTQAKKNTSLYLIITYPDPIRTV